MNYGRDMTGEGALMTDGCYADVPVNSREGRFVESQIENICD